jgi:hypothetical protein
MVSDLRRLGFVVLLVAAAGSACGSMSGRQMYSASDVRNAFAAQGEPLMTWPGSDALAKKHHWGGMFAAADPSDHAELRVMVYDRVYPTPVKSGLCGEGAVDAITRKPLGGPCQLVQRIRNVQVFYAPSRHAAETRRIRNAVAALRRG